MLESNPQSVNKDMIEPKEADVVHLLCWGATVDSITMKYLRVDESKHWVVTVWYLSPCLVWNIPIILIKTNDNNLSGKVWQMATKNLLSAYLSALGLK